MNEEGLQSDFKASVDERRSWSVNLLKIKYKSNENGKLFGGLAHSQWQPKAEAMETAVWLWMSERSCL